MERKSPLALVVLVASLVAGVSYIASWQMALPAPAATAWKGAGDLLAIYTYLGTRLIAANVQRDVRITRECSAHLGPLRWAWLAAAEGLAAPAAGTSEHGIAVVA